MKKLLIIVSLLWAANVLAESQEELYYRALKAEEAGDIPRALSLFDSAVAVSGPYTAEIQEIIDDYQEILGKTETDSVKTLSDNSWEFHTYGKINYTGLHYKKESATDAETGNEATASISASIEYETQNWNHSFEINVSGDWFIDKENMPSLDTNAWETSVGIGYSLIGNSLILDIGASINFSENEECNPDFYIWAEKYLAQISKQKFGLATSGYKNFDGPTSASFYGSWHRFAKYGWNSTIYAGARFESDSLNTLYILKWLGPSLRPSVSYKFKTAISVDAKLNLFYGFVIDEPDTDYNGIQKFSGSWAFNISWKPGVFGAFVGFEQLYRRYINLPEYNIGYSEWSLLSKLNAGIKWDM